MIEIKIDDLEKVIKEQLVNFNNEVFKKSEDGLDAAENILIENLKRRSPKKTGKFAKGWTSKKRKYKQLRVVGNTTKTKAGIPLINILEYDKNRTQFVKNTFEASKPAMIKAFINKIQGGI
jgi:hypothetical protein